MKTLSTDQKSADVSDTFWDLLRNSFQLTLIEQEKELATERTDCTEKMIEKRMYNMYEALIGSTATKCNDIMALATSYCNLGTAYKDSNVSEKLHISKNCFEKCLELLKGNELDRRAILIVMRATVQLHHSFLALKERQKVLPYLYKAIDMYLTYTKQEGDFPEPVVIFSAGVDTIDKQRDNSKLSLVTLYGYLLRNMIDLRKSGLSNLHDFIIIAHKFLNTRSLLAAVDPIKEGVVWALVTMEVARELINDCCMSEARHCIAAIQYIMNLYDEKSLKVPVIDIRGLWPFFFDRCPDTVNLSKYCKAQVAHISAIYLNALLYNPGYKLQAVKNEKTVQEVRNDADEYCPLMPKRPKTEIEALIFTELGENVENIAKKIPITFASNMDEAKMIFLLSIKKYDIAKDFFYRLGQKKMYFSVVCNIMKLYREVALFMEDKSQQIELHKQRLQFLEKLYNDSNISHYRKYYVNMIRDLAKTNTMLSLLTTEVQCDKTNIPDKNVRNELDSYFAMAIQYHVILFAIDHPLIDGSHFDKMD